MAIRQNIAYFRPPRVFRVISSVAVGPMFKAASVMLSFKNPLVPFSWILFAGIPFKCCFDNSSLTALTFDLQSITKETIWPKKFQAICELSFGTRTCKFTSGLLSVFMNSSAGKSSCSFPVLSAGTLASKDCCCAMSGGGGGGATPVGGGGSTAGIADVSSC